MIMSVILTGIRANGDLHIGNYFGAILPFVRSQALMEDYLMYIMVANLHSYTTSIDHSGFYDRCLENIRWYIASGVKVDSDKQLIFRQSHIRSIAELQWHLSCFSYYGEAKRMTQFKEKSQSNDEKNEPTTLGLLNYPVLMSADILAYNSEYIPVGDDQRQHIEFARDIAIRFNNKFADVYPEGVFCVPYNWNKQLEFRGQDEGIRIRSLSNPEKKMSKSVSDPKGTIDLADTPSNAYKKIMSSTTDSYACVDWDWEKQPGITNLLQLAYIIENVPKEEVINRWRGETKYGVLKEYVGGLVSSLLEKLQKSAESLTDEYLVQLLSENEIKVNHISDQTLGRVRKAIGLEK